MSHDITVHFLGTTSGGGSTETHNSPSLIVDMSLPARAVGRHNRWLGSYRAVDAQNRIELVLIVALQFNSTSAQIRIHVVAFDIVCLTELIFFERTLFRLHAECHRHIHPRASQEHDMAIAFVPWNYLLLPMRIEDTAELHRVLQSGHSPQARSALPTPSQCPLARASLNSSLLSLSPQQDSRPPLLDASSHLLQK
ncbi:hypothetical protein BD311DRAFT_833843 [Dichomitus squalens]|uniref:Uncharacterized protein n=1 Tax=Dichomitus squalens TaxID=114155 RepID=A0A4V2JYI4_9APHY|nr:hypothetical protein BD311DRAFT_833843 [Dichomitus squalens]